MDAAATFQRERPAAGATLARRSMASEMRALLAVMRKNWILFRRYPSWIFALFIWPILFPVGYILTARALSGPDGSALPAFRQVAGTSDYVSFIVVGTVVWMWLNMTLWDVGYQLRNEQMRGTLESNWLCPVWRLSILLGGSLTSLVVSLSFLAITLIEFRLIYGVRLVQNNLALLLLIMLLIIPSIYGLGVGFASLVLRFKEPGALVYLARGIFMIFCGISYPVEILPGWMKAIAAYLPLTYAIRDIRAVVLANAGPADIAADLVRLLAFAVIIPALGYVTFRITERQVRRSGLLGQY